MNVNFDHTDFAGHISGNTNLDFTVELWNASFTTKYDTETSVRNEPFKAEPDVNHDTLYPNQWHLSNSGQGGGCPGEDVNIEPVWDTFRGTHNEVIAIVDDGLEIGHEDLS